MLKLKTTSLKGVALDYAVAIAEGLKTDILPTEYGTGPRVFVANGRYRRYWPTLDWEQAGALLDKFHIQTSYSGNGFSNSPTREHWCAYVCEPSGKESRSSGHGPDARTAICRAVVAAVLGDEVDIPEELG